MSAPLRRNGHLVSHIVRGCESKRRFSDEYGARAAGQITGEEKQLKLYIYPCDLCRGWHLTRNKQQRKDRAVDYVFTGPPR